MALILRVDVDRAYGRRPLLRHVLSRLSSDAYFPRLEGLGYLSELRVILRLLNDAKARAYVFFRRCTLPSKRVLGLIGDGGHEIGLHLEDSRSFDSFAAERRTLERHIGRPVAAVSKHGSGGRRYGRRHYAPYEPEKYVAWARRAGMKVFLGNLEDPSMKPFMADARLHVYPSAFWLEPAWRNVKTYSVDWLRSQARGSDVVLLLHPENVLADAALFTAFEDLVHSLQTRILE